METTIIDKLFLELSQFTKAQTLKELQFEADKIVLKKVIGKNTQLEAKNKQQADFLALAKEEMDALQTELEKYQWILVSERLPKIGEEILGYFPDFVGSKFCLTNWWKKALDELANMTHWMPIPEPPKK